MIATNSGKIYRFALDHDFGYGFAEVYDFTDDSMFDGRYVFAYDRIDADVKKDYSITEIRSNAVAIGPITLYKFPNVRGVGAWKYLFKTDDFLITKQPPYKYLQAAVCGNNWTESPWWYKAGPGTNKLPDYIDYEMIRHLETRILNGHTSMATKFTMKYLLDVGKKVSDFYDLSQPGAKNMFVQLVNTYYPLGRTIEFLAQLPR
ncbi:MAG TPA: hypothetical protein VGN00_02560 [Puia sp.]|jgi:hypothetical protein